MMPSAAKTMAEMLESQASMLTADGLIGTAIEAKQEARVLRLLDEIERENIS
jgi:hypothetical protein